MTAVVEPTDAQSDWIVSIDDHVVEPPSVWQDRLPSKYAEAAPHIVHNDDGEFWVYDGKTFPTDLLEISAGRTGEEIAAEVERAGVGGRWSHSGAVAYDDMRPGCYDAKARLDDMDRDHVMASMLFPSFPRFCGQTFYEANDRELAMLCVQAWNDWMTEEWSATAPGRYIPLMIMPLWDPQAAAREIERCAAKGARSVTFSENPTMLGLPSIHDPNGYWEPVFAAAAANDVVISIHLGSSSFIYSTSSEAPRIVQVAWHGGVAASGAMLDFLFSGVFQRHPNLKMLLAEGGVGWIPYFLNQATYYYKLYPGRLPAGYPRSGVDLYQLFRDHVYSCVIAEAGTEPEAHEIRAVGIDNVLIETDYPHASSSWPHSQRTINEYLADFDADERRKITWENACRLMRFKPSLT